MAVELRTLDTSGNYSEMLPDWSDLTFSQDMIDPGSLTFVYPAAAVGCPAIADPTKTCTCLGRNAHLLIHGRQLVVLLDGVEPLNARFTYFEGTGSRIAEADGATATYGCSSNLKRFDHMLLAPAVGSFNTSPTSAPYVFTNRTPGYIVSTVIGNTMSRANVKSANPTPWLTYPFTGTFTNSVDSSGAAWPQTVDVTFDPGTIVSDVIAWCVENGFAEPAMDKKTLKLWDPGTNGTDRSGGTNPVVLQTGRDFTEATYETSSTEIVNALLVLGDPESPTNCVWLFDNASIATHGYREGIFEVPGAVQTSTQTAAGQVYLSTHSQPRWAYTYAVSAQYLEQATSPLGRPFIDYRVGDTVLILDGVENKPRRLRLLSATWPTSRTALVNLTVSDWFAERDIKLDRALRRLSL